MLNAFLLSFFFGMPAVVAVVSSSGFRSPLARAIFLWGGATFCVLAAFFLAPLFLCNGSVVSGYTSCTALNGVFANAQPLLMGSAYAYVLGGPALALVGYLAEVIHNRGAART